MIWNILLAAVLTGFGWDYAENTLHLTLNAKVDLLFYMMIFGLLWSLFEMLRLDDTVKEAEMMRMYEAGKADAQKGKNE